MSVKTCRTSDGKLLTDGARVVLTLRHGPYERVVEGTLHAFEQTERVLDADGYAVDKTVTVHWEVLTGDPHHPAVGFLPENALTRTGS